MLFKISNILLLSLVLTVTLISVTTVVRLTKQNAVLYVAAFHWSRQWRRRLECVVQEQGGHIEHLMWKLNDVTVTLDNNLDNKHVVSCC